MQNHKICYSNAKKDFTSVSLISVYDSHVYGDYTNPFNHLNNKTEPNMNCIILTLEGSASIVLKDNTKVALHKNTVFFGDYYSTQNMISHCDHWHMICYWFLPQGITIPRGVFTLHDVNPSKEINKVNKIIRLMQTELLPQLRLANISFCYYLLQLLEKLDSHTQKNTETLDQMIFYINKLNPWQAILIIICFKFIAILPSQLTYFFVCI